MFDTAPRLQRGVNGSEFKTPGKLHILRVADAKPTTPRYRRRSNEGQFWLHFSERTIVKHEEIRFIAPLHTCRPSNIFLQLYF